MEKEVKKSKLAIFIVILSSIFILIGLLSLAGSLMAKNITESSLGNLFDVFFVPLILFVIPLIALKFSVKKLYAVNFPVWAIILISAFSILFTGLADIGQTYNYFVQSEEGIEYIYDDVELVYAKKFELISQISKSVDSYTEHEKEIINTIVAARKINFETNDVDEKVESINNLDRSLQYLTINLENYPNLKSDAVIMQLISIMTDNENELLEVKKEYNDNIANFNRIVKVFPYVFIARMGGFEEKEYFSGMDIK